jgi:hypothetical protein
MDVLKRRLRINSIYTRSDGDGLTTCHVTYYSQLNNFGKTWASRRNIWNASATPSEIKREWYVCMYVEYTSNCSRNCDIIVHVCLHLLFHRKPQDNGEYHHIHACRRLLAALASGFSYSFIILLLIKTFLSYNPFTILRICRQYLHPSSSSSAHYSPHPLQLLAISIFGYSHPDPDRRTA